MSRPQDVCPPGKGTPASRRIRPRSRPVGTLEAYMPGFYRAAAGTGSEGQGNLDPTLRVRRHWWDWPLGLLHVLLASYVPGTLTYVLLAVVRVVAILLGILGAVFLVMLVRWNT